MPIILLERLPLPNLSTYTSFSVFLLVCALGVSHFDVMDHFEKTRNISAVHPWDVGLSAKMTTFELQNESPKSSFESDDSVTSPSDESDSWTRKVVTSNTDNLEEILRTITSQKSENRQARRDETQTGSNRQQTGSKQTQTGQQYKGNDGDSEGGFEEFSIRKHYDIYLLSMASVLLNETWCVWTLINMVYCCLILVGKTIQNMVFGELRVSEQEHLRDKFWNFVFYKFIFIFGVMNVQSMDDVLMWCAWFSLLGFLHFLAQLCKDRFEYLSFSPMTSRWTHMRVLALLTTILAVSCSLVIVSVFVGFQAGFHTFAFLAAECLLLILSTLFVIIRYVIHLWELNHEGVWEKKATYLYYTELVFDLLSFFIDFTHHLHMLIWGNIFLSMANLVICMQLRYLFYEFQRRVRRHKNYLRVVKNMELLYPTVSGEDLGDNDQCAICWDSLERARKLPCGHLFHNSCLRSWLEQDSTCPTCRTTLTDPQQTIHPEPEVDLDGSADDEDVPVNAGTHARTINHYFQFDASRYVSWLPSFSVEVTHTRLAPAQQVATPNDASHLNQMARQVQNVFPHIPLATLQEDLQITYNVDQTIENILEGRLTAPPTSMYPQLTQADTSDLHVVRSMALEMAPIRPASDTAPTTTSSSYSARSHLEMSRTFPEEQQSSYASRTSPESALPSMNLNCCQFSKNPEERQKMLNQRKKDLLHMAKARYLARERHNPHSECAVIDDDVTLASGLSLAGGDDVTHTRELAYQAAVRRRQVPSQEEVS